MYCFLLLFPSKLKYINFASITDNNFYSHFFLLFREFTQKFSIVRRSFVLSRKSFQRDIWKFSTWKNIWEERSWMEIIIVIKIYFVFLSKLIKSSSLSFSLFIFIFIVCRVVVECAPLRIFPSCWFVRNVAWNNY